MVQIKTHHLTQEGFDKLKAELQNLIDVQLPETLERLKEAISQGDISENAEYDTAMTEKDLIRGRISEIEMILQNVEIIESTSTGGDIKYGSVVTFVDDKKREYTMTMVGSGEVDILNNTISFESPVGSALRGKTKGEKVSIKAPSRRYEITITDVK